MTPCSSVLSPPRLHAAGAATKPPNPCGRGVNERYGARAGSGERRRRAAGWVRSACPSRTRREHGTVESGHSAHMANWQTPRLVDETEPSFPFASETLVRVSCSKFSYTCSGRSRWPLVHHLISGSMVASHGFFFFEQMVASHGWAATVHLGLPTFASLVAWAA
jgi:hypothetical protein